MKKCFQSFLSISLAVLLLFHCGIVAFAQDNTVTDTTQDITVTQETVNTLDMLKENIMTMCSDGYLYPRAYLTRAESAQLLYALAKRATR